MAEIGIWQITANQPLRLQHSQIDLEKHFENWIESDPSLVQYGLIIAGRQVHCAGGYIDLLAIDPYTLSWIVIEIKRGRIRRETLMQAVDYAASVHTMPQKVLQTIVENYLRNKGSSLKQLTHSNLLDEEFFLEDSREIKICIVGTGRDDGLERMANFLVQKYDMAISLVEFDVFQGNDGEMSLVRQLHEMDTPDEQAHGEHNQDTEIQRLFSIADQNGVGEAFRKLFESATQHGLFPRLYKWSIMYTPPQNKTRCCVVAWVKPKSGKLHAYPVPETIAEFFPIGESDAIEILGPAGERLMTYEDAIAFGKAMKTLFARIDANDA